MSEGKENLDDFLIAQYQALREEIIRNIQERALLERLSIAIPLGAFVVALTESAPGNITDNLIVVCIAASSIGALFFFKSLILVKQTESIASFLRKAEDNFGYGFSKKKREVLFWENHLISRNENQSFLKNWMFGKFFTKIRYYISIAAIIAPIIYLLLGQGAYIQEILLCISKQQAT